MNKRALVSGEILQIKSGYEDINRVFSNCLFIVTAPTDVGAEGYVINLSTGLRAPHKYKLSLGWDDFEETGGIAPHVDNTWNPGDVY